MEQWLSHLEDARPLSSLHLPGSHDSCAYTLSPRNPNSEAGALGRWMQFPIIRPIVDRFTITQDKSVYEQLRAGVRFLDIRLSLFNNEVWASHTLPTVRWADVQAQIEWFLSEQPRETVLCKVVTDNWTFQDASKREFDDNDLLRIVPGAFLVTPAHTLGECRGKICVLQTGSYLNLWPDTTRAPEMYAYFKQRPTPNANEFTIANHVLTPQPSTVVQWILLRAFVGAFALLFLTTMHHSFPYAALARLLLIVFGVGLYHASEQIDLRGLAKQVDDTYDPRFQVHIADFVSDWYVQTIVARNAQENF
jgi:hypothetical protein